MKPKKILIIDDEVMFTNIVKLTLEGRENYEVCVENDSRKAVEKIREVCPDLVILDVVMPQIDGSEIHRQLMADPILKHIPVIFLTAVVRQNEVDEHNGIIGGSFYIAKPVSADGLIHAIEKRLRS